MAFRVTLWSGGKPAMVHYISRPPEVAGACCAFQTDDGNHVRLLGTISIEEGKFEERPISGLRGAGRQGG